MKVVPAKPVMGDEYRLITEESSLKYNRVHLRLLAQGDIASGRRGEKGKKRQRKNFFMKIM